MKGWTIILFSSSSRLVYVMEVIQYRMDCGMEVEVISDNLI